MKVEDREVKGHDGWEYYVREDFHNGSRDDHGRIHEFTKLYSVVDLHVQHAWMERKRKEPQYENEVATTVNIDYAMADAGQFEI